MDIEKIEVDKVKECNIFLSIKSRKDLEKAIKGVNMFIVDLEELNLNLNVEHHLNNIIEKSVSYYRVLKTIHGKDIAKAGLMTALTSIGTLANTPETILYIVIENIEKYLE